MKITRRMSDVHAENEDAWMRVRNRDSHAPTGDRKLFQLFLEDDDDTPRPVSALCPLALFPLGLIGDDADVPHEPDDHPV